MGNMGSFSYSSVFAMTKDKLISTHFCKKKKVIKPLDFLFNYDSGINIKMWSDYKCPSTLQILTHANTYNPQNVSKHWSRLQPPCMLKNGVAFLHCAQFPLSSCGLLFFSWVCIAASSTTLSLLHTTHPLLGVTLKSVGHALCWAPVCHLLRKEMEAQWL